MKIEPDNCGNYIVMQAPKTEKVIKMRDATPEERESIDKYIKSTSKPTGVDFWDLEQDPKWIPVSERLPERNVEVLVTTEWDCITIGEMYSANDWFIHEGTTNAETDEIVAWMPLPDPYQVESEGI